MTAIGPRMRLVRSSTALTAALIFGGAVAASQQRSARPQIPERPTFDCARASGEIEPLICRDPGLSALDRKLAQVYAAASRATDADGVKRLRVEQRGWIGGRNDCWKEADKAACVRDQYRRRIAELQANYRLVRISGPVTFSCGRGQGEVVVSFFATNPETLIAERGDQVSLMYAAPAASGARYVGRNESFWEHQGEARVVWGYGAPEMRCRRPR